jgi:tripartite-type tricarboxylate transporter receptor subunit TctC
MLLAFGGLHGLLMMPGSRIAAATGELKVVVGFAAGSGVDSIARVVAERVRTELVSEI